MKKVQKAGVIGISSVFLLTGAIPAAAAVSVAPQAAASASSTSSASATASATASDSAPALPISTPVSTDTKVKRDEAVEAARRIVKIPEDFEVNSISLQELGSYGGNDPVWSINFAKQVDGRYYGSYSVSIHAETGLLIRFNNYSNDDTVKPSYPPKISLEEAKPIAQGFAQAIYPEEWLQSRYNTSAESNYKTPLNGDVRYSLRYDRIVNGVVYPSNGFRVEVNGNGEVVGFSIDWDRNTEFPDSQDVISQEEALKSWAEASKLSLTYFRPYERRSGDNSTVSVAYFLESVSLDATTGKVLTYGTSSLTKEADPLTAQPLGEAPGNNQSLGREQAIERVSGHFAIPANAKLEDASYNEYSEYGSKELQGSWTIRWSLAQEEAAEGGDAAKAILPVPSGGSIYANVSASTGEIKSFSYNDNRLYTSDPVDPKDYKVSLEEAKEKSVALVKELAPYMTHQLFLEYADPVANAEYRSSSYPAYTFTFNRKIDGITANGESVSVTVDAMSGTVTNYYNGLTAYAYPSAKPELIDADQAKELWLDQYALELQYVVDRTVNIPAGISIEKYNLMVAAGEAVLAGEASVTVRLAYVPVAKLQSAVNDLYLDAATGEWKSARTGENVSLEKAVATDLDGHWAERELQLMVEYDAVDVKDGKVNPDQAATRGELIKMLTIAMNGGYVPLVYDSSRLASFNDVASGSSYFAYVENAVDLNLIDRNPQGNFNPDQIMTRNDMAELIVRALGYHKLAQYSDLFRLDVTDANAIANKGHAGLVLGLGIMSAQDGQFRPLEEVTRAQAAVAFFRYLEQRGSLKDVSFY